MKRSTLILACLILVAVIYLWMQAHPIVLYTNKQEVKEEKSIKGELNPIGSFSPKMTTIYLSLSTEDSRALKKSRSLVCNDSELTNKFIKNFVFKPAGGDMATVESRIIITDDDTYFEGGICFDQDMEVVGIQSRTYGWLELSPNCSLKEVISHMKNNNNALIVL